MTTFDTHAEIEALIGEGMAKNAAVAIVRSIQKSRESDLSNLASKEQVAVLEKDVENIMQHSATKLDLTELRSELKADLAELRSELKTDIHNSERRLILMIGGSMVTTCGIIIGALKYFLHI